MSNFRPIHGVDIPQLSWPKADFPRYKYPLKENQRQVKLSNFVLHDQLLLLKNRENELEDDRCLANVEEHIHSQEKMGLPVAGILVEPIQAEGGDHHGSKKFFQARPLKFYQRMTQKKYF